MNTKRIEKMQQLLEELENNIQDLQKIQQNIQQIDKNYHALSSYYQNEWIDDYEHPHTEKPYPLLNQDSVRNALEEIRVEKIKTLKILVKHIEG